ncbi:MAG: Zn-ribbon domain-containing OB-fold protein [Thermoplasmata archaeon]
MTAASEALELSRCEACRARFLPRAGACPKCGSSDVLPYSSPSLGTVLAATELTAPAEGWTSPHRLALVELPEAVRLLAIVEGPMPALHTVVSVRRDGDVYRARTEPSP